MSSPHKPEWANGRLHMEDVSIKPSSLQEARAAARLYVPEEAHYTIFRDGQLKDDVKATATIAAIQAAKNTHDLIPLHQKGELNWVEVGFEVHDGNVHISAVVKAVTRQSLVMEALTAVNVAALTLVDFCRDFPGVSIKDSHIVFPKPKEKSLEISKPVHAGILIISERILAGLGTDEAGRILQKGFRDFGFLMDHYSVIANDPDKLTEKVQQWLEQDVEVVITLGGSGLGKKDITINTLEPFFDFRLEGVEQSLFNRAQIVYNGFVAQRIAVGKIGKAFIVCLPLDERLAREALALLAPNIRALFEV